MKLVTINSYLDGTGPPLRLGQDPRMIPDQDKTVEETGRRRRPERQHEEDEEEQPDLPEGSTFELIIRPDAPSEESENDAEELEPVTFDDNDGSDSDYAEDDQQQSSKPNSSSNVLIWVQKCDRCIDRKLSCHISMDRLTTSSKCDHCVSGRRPCMVQGINVVLPRPPNHSYIRTKSWKKKAKRRRDGGTHGTRIRAKSHRPAAQLYADIPRKLSSHLPRNSRQQRIEESANAVHEPTHRDHDLNREPQLDPQTRLLLVNTKKAIERCQVGCSSSTFRKKTLWCSAMMESVKQSLELVDERNLDTDAQTHLRLLRGHVQHLAELGASRTLNSGAIVASSSSTTSGFSSLTDDELLWNLYETKFDFLNSLIDQLLDLSGVSRGA